MSDRAIKSYHASAGRARHPLHNYQSLYMLRSSGASSNTALQKQHQLSSPHGHDTKNQLSTSGVGNASNISGPPKVFRKVESRSASSTMWSRNMSNNKPSMLAYPISDVSQQSGRGFVYKNDEDTNDVQVLKSPLAQYFEYSNNALCLRRDFSSIHPVSPLSTKTSHSTTSRIQPQAFNLGGCIDGGRSSMPSLVCRQEKADYLRSMQAFRKGLTDTGLTILERGDCNYQSDSTVLLGKEKLDICSTSRKSVIPMSRKDDGSFLMLNDVSPKNNYWPSFCPMKENHPSGAKSFLKNKDAMSVKLPSVDAFASPGIGVRRKRVIPEIPDLNIALPDLPDAEDLRGNSDPGTARTKCLEKTSLHAAQPSITSRRIQRRRMSASGSISFGTKSLNLSDSHPHEIVNNSFRKFRKGGLTKSELTFAGKEVIVLDSDDDADDGPAPVTISGSSKELMELEKRISSAKNEKSPSAAEGIEKTEEIAPHIGLQNWPLNPPTVRRTAEENIESTVVHKPKSSYLALEPIGEKEVPSTVAMDVIASVLK